MSKFFTSSQLKSITAGTKLGIQIGVTTGIGLSAFGSGGMTAASLLPLAGTCALSGAFLILPALYLMKKADSPFAHDLIRVVLVAGIAALGAGLLGLAIVPAIKAAVVISCCAKLLDMITAKIRGLIPQDASSSYNIDELRHTVSLGLM